MSLSVGSVTIFHLQPKKVQVQVASNRGLPKLILTGRSIASQRSTKDRLLSILKTQKIKLKSLRTTISLNPGLPISIEPHLDLSLLVGLLADYHLYSPAKGDCYIGEVDLNGHIYCTENVFYLVQAAAALGYKKLFIPQQYLSQAQLILNIELVGVDCLQQLLKGSKKPKKLIRDHSTKLADTPMLSYIFPDVNTDLISGNKLAVRALMIAATGQHSLLLIGPPGYGKTMLAQTLLSLLPPLARAEALRVAYWHQLAHQETDFSLTPPFRQLSSGVTPTILLGSAQKKMVGELRLAQQGVLFIDELGGVSSKVIELLSRLMEPAGLASDSMCLEQLHCILVMASNPCPCGQGLTDRGCRCLESRKKAYLAKFTGAFIDRVDLFCEVDESVVSHENDNNDNLNCETQRQQVASARLHLRSITSGFCGQSRMSDYAQFRSLENQLSTPAKQVLLKARVNLALSNRGLFKTLKVARTIASLEQTATISKSHVIEAIGYRQSSWVQSLTRKI